MGKKVTTFILSMIGFYLLIAFVAWQIDPSMWDIEVRVMYAVFAPMLSSLITWNPADL
jgi:hypothetical protein